MPCGRRITPDPVRLQHLVRLLLADFRLQLIVLIDDCDLQPAELAAKTGRREKPISLRLEANFLDDGAPLVQVLIQEPLRFLRAIRRELEPRADYLVPGVTFIDYL
jgi:hypothetical protein